MDRIFRDSRTTNGGLTYVSELIQKHRSLSAYSRIIPTRSILQRRSAFTIIASSEVSLTVYDILGRQVFIWESDGLLQPGSYEYLFTKSDLSSGVYIYKLTAKSSVDKLLFVDSKKMIYLK
ncbi:MAG: T9SS type A sorting domain-containing protein [Ignavibacteria bacterium]|nr:T9SS type A sorting domain-containing protein [Ignavibacteria bacterium]